MISDQNGDVLAHSYGPDYEQKYLKKASESRKKGGLLAALMMGMESQADPVFGETQALIRVHSDAKLIVIPFPSRKLVVTLLTRRAAAPDYIIDQVKNLIKSWEKK